MSEAKPRRASAIKAASKVAIHASITSKTTFKEFVDAVKKVSEVGEVEPQDFEEVELRPKKRAKIFEFIDHSDDEDRVIPSRKDKGKGKAKSNAAKIEEPAPPKVELVPREDCIICNSAPSVYACIHDEKEPGQMRASHLYCCEECAQPAKKPLADYDTACDNYEILLFERLGELQKWEDGGLVGPEPWMPNPPDKPKCWCNQTMSGLVRVFGLPELVPKSE